jgi:hypothetical protein
MSIRDENLTAPRPPTTIPYTIPLSQYSYITLVLGQNSWVKSHTQLVTAKSNQKHYRQHEPSAYTAATTTDCRLTCSDRSVPYTAAIYREIWTSAHSFVICCTSLYYYPRLDRNVARSRESDALGNALILAHVMSFFHIGSMGVMILIFLNIFCLLFISFRPQNTKNTVKVTARKIF